MCLGGGGSGAEDARKAREQAEAQAAEREARILEGQSAIESAFAQFDQPYFDQYSRSIVDYQRPQIQDQFNDVSGKLTAALAGRGMLESTAGANQLSRLGGAFADESARIENEAANAAQQLRGNVENQRSDLFTLNLASADPQAVSASAIGNATALAAPAPTTAVGRVFDGFLQPVQAYRSAYNYAAPAPRGSSAPVASGGGSGRVVR